MLRYLNEYILEGTPCTPYSSAIYCYSDRASNKMKVCLGHAGIGQWSVLFNMNRECNIRPYVAISKLVPTDLFNCKVAGQSIMCLPKNFNVDVVFPGRKIKIVNVDCPSGAIGFGDIDKVYCRYKTPVKSCRPPKFLSDYKGKRVCKEIRNYFIHIWQLAPNFEFQILDENKSQFYHLYQKGIKEYQR